MKKRDDATYLHDILDSVRLIEQFLKGITYQGFLGDALRQNAVLRCLEVVGEAARNVSASLRSRYPAVPWNDIIGMRHKIAHDYTDIQLPMVWDTVTNDLPVFKKQVEQILEDLAGRGG